MGNRYGLWLRSEADIGNVLSARDFFIANIPDDMWPLQSEEMYEPAKDEEDLSPVWYTDEMLRMSPDVKNWYSKSGFGHIFLEPSYFDLKPFIVDPGLVYAIDMWQTDELDELLALLFRLAFKAQAGGTDVFIQYSPHVNSVDIQLFSGKWEKGKPPRWSSMIYLNEYHNEAERHIREAILKIAEDWQPGLMSSKYTNETSAAQGSAK
ncbi:hypothetical protein [Thiomicrospira sp.]|uniref:hypothetical protein n=1 Tax=Thiomicrospira sp. TaxID=935 RepID=UPI002F95647E